MTETEFDTNLTPIASAEYSAAAFAAAAAFDSVLTVPAGTQEIWVSFSREARITPVGTATASFGHLVSAGRIYVIKAKQHDISCIGTGGAVNVIAMYTKPAAVTKV